MSAGKASISLKGTKVPSTKSPSQSKAAEAPKDPVTVDELSGVFSTLILYAKDLRTLEAFITTNGDSENGYLLSTASGVSVNKGDVSKLWTKFFDALETAKGQIRTVKKKASTPRTKSVTFYYISETFVDFLYGSNLGNGLSVAFAEKMEPKQRVASVANNYERVQQIEMGAERARLDGGLSDKDQKTEYSKYREVLEIYNSDAAFHRENYNVNAFHLFKGKKVLDLDDAAQMISIKENLSVLFNSKVSAIPHLLRLWYLYIRVNRLSVPGEGIRFTVARGTELSDLFDNPYTWVFFDESRGETVDYLVDGSKDHLANGKSQSKTDARKKERAETVGDRRTALEGRTILQHLARYTNITDDRGRLDESRRGMMDISRALVDENGKARTTRNGQKVRDEAKYKEVMSSGRGVLLGYVMTFINSWIIPDVFLPSKSIDVLTDPETLAQYKAQDLYLDYVLKGVKLADDYSNKLAAQENKPAKKSPTKKGVAPKKLGK